MENLSELDDVKRRLCDLVTEEQIRDVKERYGDIPVPELVHAVAFRVGVSGITGVQEAVLVSHQKELAELKDKTKELEDVVRKQNEEIAKLQKDLRDSNVRVDRLVTRTEDVARAVKAMNREKASRLRKRKK
jgi:hypothetical protein